MYLFTKDKGICACEIFMAPAATKSKLIFLWQRQQNNVPHKITLLVVGLSVCQALLLSMPHPLPGTLVSVKITVKVTRSLTLVSFKNCHISCVSM